VAKILRNDQVWSDGAEEVRIDRVDALAAGDKIPHLPVQLRGRSVRIDSRANQNRLVSRRGGKVAFMRDTRNAIAPTKREENLGGGRQ